MTTATTQTTLTSAPSKMVLLSRVYQKGTAKKVVKQRIMVSATDVTSFRPRKKFTGHQTTLVLANKQVVNVSEDFDQVKAKLARAGVVFA